MQTFGPTLINSVAPVAFSFAGTGIAQLRSLEVDNELSVGVKVTIGVSTYLCPPNSTERFRMYGTETSFTITPLSAPATPGNVSAMAFTVQDLIPESESRRAGF